VLRRVGRFRCLNADKGALAKLCRQVDEAGPPARLIDGARHGRLEDSGGFPGYEEIMEALAGPDHPDHAEHFAGVAEMTGSDMPLDPAFLDIAAVNQTLVRVFFRLCSPAGPTPRSASARQG